MTTLLLVRHAETDAVGKLLAGSQPGWPLNETGQRQARQLARTLSRYPLAAIYTSPLPRTRQTAAYLAQPSGLEIEDAEALREIDFGDWTGQTIANLHPSPEWRRFNECRGNARPPNGESLLEVQSRMVRQADILRQRHPEQMVAMVSHAEPLRALLAHFLGVPLDLTLRLQLDPASVSVVQTSGWAPTILCLNHKGELPI